MKEVPVLPDSNQISRAHVYKDHVDTDVIIPARYLNQSDPEHLKRYCMIDIDPDFSNRMKPDDVIIAGKNFGCGSSREHAPLAIKSSGIRYVIAESFARIFLRNALNIGLTVIEADTAVLNAENGDQIVVDLTQGRIHNLSKRTHCTFNPPPEFIRQLVAVGGLIAYTTLKGGD